MFAKCVDLLNNKNYLVPNEQTILFGWEEYTISKHKNCKDNNDENGKFQFIIIFWMVAVEFLQQT